MNDPVVGTHTNKHPHVFINKDNHFSIIIDRLISAVILVGWCCFRPITLLPAILYPSLYCILLSRMKLRTTSNLCCLIHPCVAYVDIDLKAVEIFVILFFIYSLFYMYYMKIVRLCVYMMDIQPKIK